MLAHAARWALITVAGGGAVTGALVACMLVSGRRSSASALCSSRFLCRCLDDTRLFAVQRRRGPCRIGLDRAERASGSADKHRHERRNGISDHDGHDLWVDPAAHAVRALPSSICLNAAQASYASQRRSRMPSVHHLARIHMNVGSSWRTKRLTWAFDLLFPHSGTIFPRDCLLARMRQNWSFGSGGHRVVK